MTVTNSSSLVTVAGITLRRVTGPKSAIRADRSDMLVLTVPDETPAEKVQRFVLRHYSALHRWTTRDEAANAWAPIVKELVAAEGFPLGGRSHRLRWQRPTIPHAAAFEPAEHGVWLKVEPALSDDASRAVGAIIDCYRRETIDVVRSRYGQYADRLGFGPLASIAVTDDEARWVGLRANGDGLAVTAHWALAQFGIGSVNYLLCRALCARAKRSMEAIFPGPYARRDMQREAREIWTGAIKA
jgi:hypothetical protein